LQRKCTRILGKGSHIRLHLVEDLVDGIVGR
jgi:hypothetical protein